MPEMKKDQQQSQQLYSTELISGLSPLVKMNQIGSVLQVKLSDLGSELTELLVNQTGVQELDNITIVPHLAQNSANLDHLVVVAYFVTEGQKEGTTQNIWYKGKGARVENGERLNLVNMAGGNVSEGGQFSMSNNFKDAFKAFVKWNDKGNPMMNLKLVMNKGSYRVASLELDWQIMLQLALGIEPQDPYTYSVLCVNPINNDFLLTLMKRIVDNRERKGKHSKINYARLQADMYQRVNGAVNKRDY